MSIPSTIPTPKMADGDGPRRRRARSSRRVRPSRASSPAATRTARRVPAGASRRVADDRPVGRAPHDRVAALQRRAAGASTPSAAVAVSSPARGDPDARRRGRRARAARSRGRRSRARSRGVSRAPESTVRVRAVEQQARPLAGHRQLGRRAEPVERATLRGDLAGRGLRGAGRGAGRQASPGGGELRPRPRPDPGTTSSAAADGVAARTSTAKSARPYPRPGAPTPHTTGNEWPTTARTTFSSLNDQRS